MNVTSLYQLTGKDENGGGENEPEWRTRGENRKRGEIEERQTKRGEKTKRKIV